MGYRVAAYITVYQDSYALDRCVTALDNQSYPIQEIFVVDNSPSQLFSSNRYKNVVIDFHPENLGVAGGMKLGISWAIEKGYDFLWLFDQDSIIASDLLEKLLVKFEDLKENGNSVGIISVLPIDANNTSEEIHGWIFSDYRLIPAPGHFEPLDFYPCDVVITSGALVNLKAAKNVEPPMSELFLDAADWAYCMNFRNKGYEVIVLKTAKMMHPIGNYSKVKVRGIRDKEIITYLCSPSRYYYTCRNHTFFETRASTKKFLLKSVVRRLFYLTKTLGRILLYEPDFLLIKMWACILGTFDGFRGRLGKTW